MSITERYLEAIITGNKYFEIDDAELGNGTIQNIPYEANQKSYGCLLYRVE
jgi:hypothetical protein